MSFDVTFEPRGVYMRFTGVLTSASLMEAASTIWGAPEWDKCEYELSDYTAVTGVDLEATVSDRARYMSKAATLSSMRSKIALVTGDRDDVRALMQSYAERWTETDIKVRVFASVEEARTWL